MNYFAYDSCFTQFNTNDNVSKDTAKLIVIIDKLKLEIQITHVRMKKEINLLKEQVLKRNSDEERQNILLSIEKLKKELVMRNRVIQEKILELLKSMML
jgi:hypothetical protein